MAIDPKASVSSASSAVATQVSTSVSQTLPAAVHTIASLGEAFAAAAAANVIDTSKLPIGIPTLNDKGHLGFSTLFNY